jgi:phosphatidate phosphatase PAH1
MLETWADKGYLIVYVTGRPDFLRPMTERWVEPRFPPGPMRLTDTNGQALPTNDGVGTYKLSFIEYLESQGIDIVAAYGNATTDIYAYLASGVPADRVFTIGRHAGEEGTVALPGSYTDHLPWVEARPPATIKAPPAFGWW